MFKNIFFFFCCLAPALSNASDLENYFEEFPIYEEVYGYLDKQINHPCFECKYDVAKKKDGYYLVINNLSNIDSKHIEFIKVWDQNTKQWSTPDISRFADFNADIENGQIKGLTGYYINKKFNRFYLYGYEGYSLDIINLLRDEDNLSTAELEILARSYSQMSTDNIHFNQYGNSSLIAKKYDIPLYTKTSPERVEACMNYADSSIACYKRILKIDPHFEPMIIDHVNLKINHDRMHYYHLLMAVREEEKAKKYLDQVNYSQQHLDWSKHYLNICDKNAIFIANGDTDTYTLWYLQLKKGFRTDVTVINKALMQAKWYMMMVTESGNITSSFSRTEIANLPFYRYSNEDEEEDLYEDYSTWIAKIKDNTSEEYNGQTYPVYTKNLKMEYLQKDLKIHLTYRYLAFDDLFLLDIIAKNPNRKIYFSTHINANGVGLLKNLIKLNTNYQLVPETQKSLSSEESFAAFNERLTNINTEQLFHLRNLSLTSLRDFLHDIKQAYQTKDEEAGNLALNKFQKKASLDEIIHFNDYTVLRSYSSLLDAHDTLENNNLKKRLLPAIKSRINNGPMDKFDIDDYVADLKSALYLYSAATPTTIRNPLYQKYQGKSYYTPMDTEVIEVLNQKINQLLSDSFYTSLYWNLTDLELIRDNVKAILED